MKVDQSTDILLLIHGTHMLKGGWGVLVCLEFVNRAPSLHQRISGDYFKSTNYYYFFFILNINRLVTCLYL